MTKKLITDYTDTELQKVVKQRKFLLGLMLGILLLMIAGASSDFYYSGKFIKLIQPLCFLPITYLTFTEYQKAKQEQSIRAKQGK